MTEQLKKRTAVALAWSAMQSWGVKLFALAVFFVLARFLSPAELGLAQTVILILAFVAILAEQGFQDAIVQRKDLSHDDLNLPFAVSMLTAVVASAVLFFFSHQIAELLKVPGAASLIAISAVIPPLTAASIFEIAMRRRSMDFKTPAKAALFAGLISCSVALVMAVAGFGAASLIGQAIATAVITFLVLYRKPLWTPGQRFVTSSFRSILRYSTNAFGSRLLDFFSGKIIDLIILSKFGLAGLGVYAVGSKLYLTMLQLLASTLIDVALSALSKLTGDVERMRRSYLRFLFLSSFAVTPLFAMVAAFAPEICLILFGPQWDGAQQVTRWLCFLGAVQVVQFFNSSAIGAIGKAGQIFIMNVLKFAFGIAALLLLPVSTITDVAACYVVAQLCVTPVSFYLGARATLTPLRNVMLASIPGFACSGIAYLVVVWSRDLMFISGSDDFLRMVLLSIVFVVTYLLAGAVVAGEKLMQEVKSILVLLTHTSGQTHA
ncbi:lipopolysaccharide biosynthesis protein [Denitromonas ohlonensis]|uniref:Lipopolysaccharide biosynthesis protein n=2 Tax=Denitromonas TaxID=139331 RepID=A0A557SL00_9RHOO|nr:lipopolysaccharide biosynthesis protein [Denitromonas ohlonensis]TVO68103.1 lipopolysaccharide biosynthesis protein [Denitromonas ohlonensis]TVO77992.1 lipopolysaccharide biosynthesis protein [Denitromonas ohlonensis]